MVDLSPKAHRFQIFAGLISVIVIFSILVALPYFNRDNFNHLETIKQKGVIQVLTINAASTYYQDADGDTGFEFHLAQLFAETIGVTLEIKAVNRFADIYTELQFGAGDLAAAGLSEWDQTHIPSIKYSPSYHQVTQQLIYRKGQNPRPKSLAAISSGILEVIEGTSHKELLTALQKELPDLKWRINEEIESEELIEQVDEGIVDYAIADSHIIALQRRFYPEIRIAFEVGKPKQLRWAVKSTDDNSLLKAIQKFMHDIKNDGRLEQLIHRYYSHVAKFNYSDIQTFNQHVNERLPKYRSIFMREALAHNIDWHLLAAIGYQESLWNPKAKSPTGVRGMMMLTQSTAKQVKIENRLDVEQSIRGGAIYFNRVLSKIPERIPQPDRNWLALASYNVGFGHLEDARKLTQINGGDADKWIDIKKNLPLLGRKKWYKTTKHGYARGWEPVKYVENIRKYVELLAGIESRKNTELGKAPPPTPNKELSIAPSL